MPDAVGIEDRIATNAFKLLLVLLQTSSPKLYGSEVAHLRVSEREDFFVFPYSALCPDNF